MRPPVSRAAAFCGITSFLACGLSRPLLADDSTLQRRVNEVHALIWANYVQPDTQLLITRLTLAGKPFYAAGVLASPSLEDTSLYGGLYLDALIQRYETTRKDGAAAEARIIFQGLLRNATISPSKGLLARGRFPDGVSYRGNPSVDQYTGVIFALWRYHRSSLATDAEKAQIRSVLDAMLSRFERDSWVILDENDDTTTVAWELGYLDATRAERLLGFLLAAYDVTGNEHWLRVYEQKKKRRLGLCRNYDVRVTGRPYPAWVQLQNALALRILIDVTKDPGDLAVYRQGARTAISSALPQLEAYKKLLAPRAGKSENESVTREKLVAAKLWSESALGPLIRNPLELISTILLLDEDEFYPPAVAAYREMMASFNFADFRYVGFVYEGEYNYWLAVRRHLLAYNPSIEGETQAESYRILLQDVYGDPLHATISLR